MDKNHRLYLRNLSSSVTKNVIEERFKNYGAVTNIEIKEKANALGNNGKFAFVNIVTSDRKLNDCFQDLKNLTIDGCQIRMEMAKESFLARLQRERESSKMALPENIQVPKHVIEPINIVPLVKPEVVRRPSRKFFNIDDQEVSNFDITHKYIPEKVVDSQPKAIMQHEFVVQKKINVSDEKRLKSLEEKKKAFKIKENLIRQALNSVDQKSVATRKFFSDDLESLNETSVEQKKKKRLFNDDDEDEGDGEILENGEFKISKNINKKLQTLQQNYGNDKRFTLDDRFVEVEDNVEVNNADSLSGLNGERDWQLDILQSVLGKPMRSSRIDETADKRKKGMIRYDPMKNEHAECKTPIVKSRNPKKMNKADKVLTENVDDQQKHPELSKDTFYNVSENFANTLKQDEQFSLLKTFRAAKSGTDDPIDEEIYEEREHRFNFSTKNPFKYDSSADEGENYEDEINNKSIEKSEAKSNWNDRLFFNDNDIRFEDAQKFFGKQAEKNTDFSTLRRELKQIVRSKIQNNLRKKVTWKKKKINKS
ncbi:nucleolar protein 8 isoform X1 [Neodiprion lecontei]|uniref:Nucleolar protein 8 isoform X1 n=1 Tax=Neodiprion lecontei TaxID=441921 RepID=A0A6J0CE60_NEOLC|nr:nucleolar protein 8 isoform X1 [Neodiprion lecontei]